MTAPTRLVGSAADTWATSLYADVLEHIPDLQPGPLAIQTYAQMRRDANLAAILSGYTLQLRRASWQIDGRGCRPEVVARVADDLGLSVAGQESVGGARVRGVSWNEHLRSALLMLTYGHQCHELLAQVDGAGAARLVALAERMPHTLQAIHVDPQTGDFTGVTQTVVVRENVPQIRADRLAFYCHEREGANWHGTSMLRSAYPAWLIKREMIRTHASANRRFGMGVPVMKALPGTMPSGPQMLEALDLASAARVGDQSGAAVPPGFTFELVGLTGSVPDTLAFIEWLDRQMTRAALMGHLELGQGDSSGSRALGAALIDSWTLALESLGEAVCDVATRQIAARIVGWNWGEEEPVPRVTVSGIGSRREVTAESLDLLMRSGALSSDPGLEAWVRREYRLPEREQVSSPPPVTPPPAPVAASKPRSRSRRRHSSGQLALFAAADDEPAPATNFAELQTQWEQAKADLLAQWPEAAQPMVDELTAEVEAAITAGDLAALGALVVSAATVSALAGVIADAAVGLAALAAAGVVAEAAAQGVTVQAPDNAGADRSRAAAEALAGVIASGYATGAGRAALQVAGPDANPSAVAEAARVHLAELGVSENGWVAENVGGALTAAQNAGRVAVMESASATVPVGLTLRWQAREDNEDGNRCKPCADIHLTYFESLAEANAAYPIGFHACEGRLRCRGHLAPIWA